MAEGRFPCYLKGAPELLLPRCRQFFGKDGPQPLNPAVLSALWQKEAAHGMRVLCLCAAGGAEEDGLTLLALALIRDSLRPEAPAAARIPPGPSLRAQGFCGAAGRCSPPGSFPR